MNNSFSSFPEVSFIDNMTLEDLQTDMINWYMERYQELTGKNVDLALANPYRLILDSCALAIYQLMQYVDAAGKKNLLKYSYGDFLDNIGALRGIQRRIGTKANATFRFSLASARTSATSIPKGSRMSFNNIFFETVEYAEIPVGSLYVDVLCTCTEAGSFANGYLIGEINTIVDSLPFIASAENITATANGTDREDDDTYAQRIYLAPSSYSVAGPEEAYRYFTLNYSSEIADVSIYSPDAGEVSIVVVLQNGELPNENFLTLLKNYLNDGTKKPLTDLITVSAPTVESYNIQFTYYINNSDRNIASQIQTAVTDAVNDYVQWQDTKIGRDIVPDELIKRVINAGAKRVVLTSPTFDTVADNNIAHHGTINITYGGIEND